MKPISVQMPPQVSTHDRKGVGNEQPKMGRVNVRVNKRTLDMAPVTIASFTISLLSCESLHPLQQICMSHKKIIHQRLAFHSVSPSKRTYAIGRNTLRWPKCLFRSIRHRHASLPILSRQSPCTDSLSRCCRSLHYIRRTRYLYI